MSVPVRRQAVAAVLIVDDHPLVRAGFRRLLANEPDLKISGEAEGQSQALREFRRQPADVVTADISLQNGSGLELTRELLALCPGTRVLICSMHDETLFAERALRAGASGYLNKCEPVEHLLTAIRRVLNGHVYLSPSMTERMLCRNLGNGDHRLRSPQETLSDRELEVFEQIGRGLTTRQTAEHLHLSPKTIETYREHIKAKLDLKNATELTQHAVQWVLECH